MKEGTLTEKDIQEQYQELVQLISSQGDRIDQRFESVNEQFKAMGILLNAVRSLSESGDTIVKGELYEIRREMQSELSALRTEVSEIKRVVLLIAGQAR